MNREPTLEERNALNWLYSDGPSHPWPRWVTLLNVVMFVHACRQPLFRQHLRQHLSALARYAAWSVFTCGIGFFVLLPSYGWWLLTVAEDGEAHRPARRW